LDELFAEKLAPGSCQGLVWFTCYILFGNRKMQPTTFVSLFSELLYGETVDEGINLFDLCAHRVLVF